MANTSITPSGSRRLYPLYLSLPWTFQEQTAVQQALPKEVLWRAAFRARRRELGGAVSQGSYQVKPFAVPVQLK